MNTSLSDRIKNNYENRYRFYLPRRSNFILRVDGKAFSTYTRQLNKPFDLDMSESMDAVALFLLSEVMGAKAAYTQSDEISVLFTDNDTTVSECWFDGNIQKISSVTASMASAVFNDKMQTAKLAVSPFKIPLAFFDARVFCIPDKDEVVNYFLHRYQDCSRNSVSMYARSKFSHNQLEGKSTSEMHEMLHTAGYNWADLSDRDKNGSLFIKQKMGLITGEDDVVNRKVVSRIVLSDVKSFDSWKKILTRTYE